MGRMAKLISEAPRKRREEVAAKLPEAAKVFGRAIEQVLGVQGSPSDRSKPGQPPRRQTGRGLAETKAVADPTTLAVTIVTNKYMEMHNQERPWLEPVLAIALPAFRKLISRR